MPLQLIFTSAARGLSAGRSGFCTVARHRAMSERLAAQLEALGTPHENAEGSTFTFRTMEASGRTWYVLSRFVARGLDYTRRDNRLAHHLVFTQEEAAVSPPPAALAARWTGWCEEWTKEPVWLEDETNALQLTPYAPLAPATTWRELTGTGAKAAWLAGSQGPARISLLHPPAAAQLLRLLAESSALLGKAAWAATFTTDAAVTGADDFLWAVGPAAGRPCVDLRTAANTPAPTGDFARHAATGVPSPLALSGGRPTTQVKPDARGAQVALYAVVAALVVAASVLGYFLFRDSTPSQVARPATTTVTTPTPPPVVDTARIDEINRAHQALRNLEQRLAAQDYVGAGRLWLESAASSPDFAKNYREQILPHLRTQYAEATAAQLTARLDKPGVATSARLARAVASEAVEALDLGRQLGFADDASWGRLTEAAERARLVADLDIRPTILIPGAWVTADLGANGPSQAEFKLSPAAAEQVGRFIDASGASRNTSVPVRLRILPLTSLHQRSDTQWALGEIRRGGQSDWIESAPEPGRPPAIAVAIGSRSNVVTLQFADRSGSQADANRLLEVALVNGDRRCFALIAEPRNLRPVNLGLAGLRMDPDTRVVTAAPWAEPAVASLIWTGGTLGLYPDGHEFPDRDLPSVRATRSMLETDLIRLEHRSGPGQPSSATLAERRKALGANDGVQAGAPWTLLGVDPRGGRGPAFIEFR